MVSSMRLRIWEECGEAKSRELALTTKNNNNNKKTLKLWYLEQYPVCGRQPINPC
jgi:hypothetical protein